ncbi:MAG: hypothetical protein KF703_03030 [Actinobacteria bacterium]|nr:hypothetical protein [Actinomycetota bacterium]
MTVARQLGAVAVSGLLALAGCGVQAADDVSGPSTTTATTTPGSTTRTPTSTSTSTTTTEAPTTAPATTAPATTTSVPGSDDAARADFVERANRICREGGAALAGQEPDTSDQAALAAYVTDTFVPAVRRQLDDIRALGFPPGDEAELAAILDDTDAALDRLAADPIGVIDSGRDPFADVNQRLNAYGLTDCGAS